MIQFHSFAQGYSVLLTLFVEEAILSPLCILSTLVKDRLTVHVWIDLGLSILFHWSIFMPFLQVPYCFNHCGFATYLEIWKWGVSSFLLFKIVLTLLFFYRSIWILEFFFYIRKIRQNPWRVSWGWHWICIMSLLTISSLPILEQDVFPFICISFNFFCQCFIVFSVQVFLFFG